MTDTLNKFGPLAGRILIALIFLVSGLGKITGFAGTAGYMSNKGIPAAEALLVVTIVIEVGAALMIIAGYKIRVAALALLLWMIPVTLLFHAFWAVPAAEQQLQQIMFLKNLGLMGGMLLLMAFGSGRLSVERS